MPEMVLVAHQGHALYREEGACRDGRWGCTCGALKLPSHIQGPEAFSAFADHMSIDLPGPGITGS
jgi:hypothetical protein